MFLVRALKVFFAASLLVVLSACGPSQEEKMRIAQQACATIMATRKFESSKRIQVLNEAREEVGDYDYPYPLDDDFLWSSLSLAAHACIDNIVKPPPPPPKTQAQLEAEAAEAEARAKETEERRIAEEKAAEEAKRKAEEKESTLLKTLKIHTFTAHQNQKN